MLCNEVVSLGLTSEVWKKEFQFSSLSFGSIVELFLSMFWNLFQKGLQSRAWHSQKLQDVQKETWLSLVAKTLKQCYFVGELWWSVFFLRWVMNETEFRCTGWFSRKLGLLSSLCKMSSKQSNLVIWVCGWVAFVIAVMILDSKPPKKDARHGKMVVCPVKPLADCRAGPPSTTRKSTKCRKEKRLPWVNRRVKMMEMAERFFRLKVLQLYLLNAAFNLVVFRY